MSDIHKQIAQAKAALEAAQANLAHLEALADAPSNEEVAISVSIALSSMDEHPLRVLKRRGEEIIVQNKQSGARYVIEVVSVSETYGKDVEAHG